LFLAQTGIGNTAFQFAAAKNNVETLKKMWVWAEETQLNPNVLTNKLLLARDKFGFNAGQPAADQGCLEALQIFWIWIKEEELNKF
jgi:hypothetical protein